MERATQIAQIRRIFDYLDSKSTTMAETIYRNSVSDYTCPEQLAAERQKLFRDYPLFLGLSCQLREPGDFLTDDFGSAPILMMRGDSGELNAFINVCRHRGARVLQGCGRAKRRSAAPTTLGPTIGRAGWPAFPRGTASKKSSARRTASAVCL